jgi:pimeloyl-ACP methyl ester carboxylesterase
VIRFHHAPRRLAVGARTWVGAAVVAVLAAVIGPPGAGAAAPEAYATTLPGLRLAGGDAEALGAAHVEVRDGSVCVELNLSATTLPAAAARLVGPSGTVALPPPGSDGRSSGCTDGGPTDLAGATVEVSGVAAGGLLPTAVEGTLLGARLHGMAGGAVATVAANPERGRLCTEVTGGARLRRIADGAVVADLPERGCVRGLPADLVAAVADRPDGFEVETATASGPLAPATSFAGPALPRFTPGPCGEEVVASPRIACGTLTVAEDRSDPTGPTVELPVAIIRTASPAPQPDPVVYFEGGPGFGALGNAGSFLEHEYGADRDLILFDQRGTGGARPSLNCPEVEEATWQYYATTDAAEVELERTWTAFDACRDRLRAAGIDLDMYNTRASADDVADLRVALGIDRWNLFGVSYGTTLALQTLRAHPDGVRSVVLDSVYPTTVSGGSERLVAGADRALGVLYAGCAADPRCAAAYPGLEQAVADVLARFDAAPHAATVADPFTGQSRPVNITGKDILSGLFQALYDDDLIPVIPSLAAELRAGNAGIIDLFAGSAIPLAIQPSEGMGASVECSDRAAFPDDVLATIAARPEWGSLVAGGAPHCGRWGVTPAPAGFNDVVASDVPALVLADEYDPITPPADGRAAADALGHATLVEFPGLGHGAVFSHPCPEAVYKSFLADPAAPDTSCVGGMGPPAWAVPTPSLSP